MNGARAITILLSIVLFQPAAGWAVAVEEEALVPTLTPRSGPRGISRFNNETLDSLFGGPKGERLERDQGSGHLEARNKPTVLALPSSESRPAKLSRRTSPRAAAASRIADKGRAHLKAGDYEKALLAFEKSLSLYPNPYLYYELARAHHFLAQYRESSSFVDAAQPWLVDHPESSSALARIKAENGRALAKETAARRAVRQEGGADRRQEGPPLDRTNAFMASLLAVTLGGMLLYLLMIAARKSQASVRSQPPAQS
jgi:tetratricopeptide (TPR) repeat protein